MPRSRIHRFAHQHKPHPVEISWNSRVSCRDEIPGKFACISLKKFCIVWENIKSFRFDTIPRHGQAMFMDNAFRQLTVSLLVFTNTFSWKGRKNWDIPEARRFFELAKVSIFAFRFYAHVRFYMMPIPHWKWIHISRRHRRSPHSCPVSGGRSCTRLGHFCRQTSQIVLLLGNRASC